MKNCRRTTEVLTGEKHRAGPAWNPPHVQQLALNPI